MNKLFVILAGCLACIELALAASSRPASTGPATRPAGAATTAPAPYPPAALVEACAKAAAELRSRLPGAFLVESHPPFVLAGNLPAQRMKGCVEWSVLRPAKVMWKSYFQVRPTEVITILLFADDASYRAEAKRLFGDERVPHFGYYRPGDRTLVMNIDTGTGTLVHELTHALIAFDFPNVPTWFNEGLASLHEQCSIGADEIVGWVNWRLPVLQEAIRAGTLRPLRDLMTADDFYGPQLARNYAQGRYFVMYMQQQELLKKFYRRLHGHAQGEDASVRAVEKVFGKGLEAVEKDYLAWAAALKPR